MGGCKVLMIPGPVEVPPELMMVMAMPLKPHYGFEWVNVYNECRGLLKEVFKTKGDVFILAGSGTAAIEASVVSVVEPGDKVLTIVNGFFGLRFKEVVEANEGRPIVLDVEWGRAVDPDDVRKALKENGDVKAITVVHNETSTGVLNPLKELGEVAKEFDVLLLVDAVSSLGGIRIEMDKWGVDICASASQKCLGAPPGLAPIAVNERVWDVIEGRRNPPRGFYLNLSVWRRYEAEWGDWHPQPITMPVSTILVLKESLKRMMDEGLEKVFTRHEVVAKALREGLRAIDLKTLPMEKDASSTVTAVNMPEGVEGEELLRIMKEKHNIFIAGGVGLLKNKVFRVGHMAHTATSQHITMTLSALEMTLKELGYKFKLGQSLQKAQEHLSRLYS